MISLRRGKLSCSSPYVSDNVDFTARCEALGLLYLFTVDRRNILLLGDWFADLLQPELKVHINYHVIRISIFGTQKIAGKDGKEIEPTTEIYKENIFCYTQLSQKRMLYDSGANHQ